VHGILCQETTLVDRIAEPRLNWFWHVSRMGSEQKHYLLYQWEKKPRKTTEEIDGQAGSRGGSRRAMLRTYTWLKLSQTDTQMDGQTLCDNKG